MERIAVVGSRAFRPLDSVTDFVNGLPDGVIIVSGSAPGVDTEAERAAKARGLSTEIFPADWSKGKGAGFARNTTIAEACDQLVAFWDGASRGTLDTWQKARLLGKRVELRMWVPGFGIIVGAP